MATRRDKLDLSLYLVHQQESLLPGVSHDVALRQALDGGVTIVQLREKKASTSDFLALAQQSKAICDEYGVPLLINDRIDIALAVKADGVHIGQDDMPCPLARQLLGPEAIIGVSANTVEEALKAVQDGADYLGIGPCYETISKADAKGTMGPRGVARILDGLAASPKVKTVTIGGVNASNIRRILHGAVSIAGHPLDGVAVISAIISSPDIKAAAVALASEILAFKAGHAAPVSPPSFTFDFAPLYERVRQSHALIQQITNTVVQNDSANVTLALDCSPIMSASPEEAEDLSRVLGCLLINLGTLTSGQVAAMMVAGKCANQRRKPVVFDPVGVGASDLRKSTTTKLLNHAQMTVIKGNAAEIHALAGVTSIATRGVDSVDDDTSAGPSPLVARDLALRERCIVAMTGRQDIVSDGRTTIRLSNGHPLLGKITGSGCMTGSSIACFAASAWRADAPDTGGCVEGNMLLATVAGISAINVAAEKAANREDVRGPNTFRAALIDEVYALTAKDVQERVKWEVVDVDAIA